MDLANKDVFIVIGPSRTGKGTLLTALQGETMKLVKKADVKDKKMFDSIAQTAQTVMTPVDANGQPIES